jgi:CRISPR-associated protein Cas1
MRDHRTQSPTTHLRGHDRIRVLDGYGIKVYVERGHLVIHDGLGRDRRTEHLNRATSYLKRLVVIGHTGFVTLEALRWIRDVGAAFVQVDRDGNLIAASAPERLHESKLRRAQVLAAESDVGRRATIELLRAKLDGQADLVERRLAHLRPTLTRNHRRVVSVADAIREQARAMHPDLSYSELRKLESIAGRYYWQTWARVPIQFDRDWIDRVPEHWHRAGPRTSQMDRQWPRRAITPAHALLNYGYAILETEALIAAYTLGFDPSLGLMHADVRYRGGLAIDLMEPARPVVDELVLTLLEGQELQRGDVLETPRGVCRVGRRLAGELAPIAPALRDALAPHAERLARRLLRAPNHPTPLTRRRHREALDRVSAGARAS